MCKSVAVKRILKNVMCGDVDSSAETETELIIFQCIPFISASSTLTH